MSNPKDAEILDNLKKKRKGETKPQAAKLADLLSVDKAVAGQSWGCFSFLSPDKIIKDKNMFYFDEFLKVWEFRKCMEKFVMFNKFISFKYKIDFEEVMKDYEHFIKSEKKSIIEDTVEGDYKTFIEQKGDELDKKFDVEHQFQTSVRGFKSRGNFATQEEAEFRAKMLREIEPDFDIFVGPVGTWLCWDPDAYKTGRIEHLEEELNQLAHEKKKNDDAAKAAFDKRVLDAKTKAIEDNIENSARTGSTISQSIDKDGNLVNSARMSTQEENLRKSRGTDISSTDIYSEMFEGNDDMVVKNKNKNNVQSLLK